MNGETKTDPMSALREQTTLAKTRLYGVRLRFASSASRLRRAVEQLGVLTAASFLALSCASTPPAPDTGLEPERAPAPIEREAPKPVATTPVRASFTYAPGVAAYVVTTDATIAEIDSAPSSARTFREIARLQIAIAAAAERVVVSTTGTVEGTTGASVIQPFVDTLRVESTATDSAPRMPICGRDTVPPMHLVTLLPAVPQELREGTMWQRRHVYASCQGTIPVRVERTDSYVVTGSAPQVSRAGVTITRNSSLAFSGLGVEGQHNVRLTGSGSGQATLVLDATMGRLVETVEESLTEIQLTASGRTRRFSQRIARTARIQ